MTANPLKRLGELGQSVWYDFIRRDLYHGPELAAADRRGRPARHDLEPDDLPEGHRGLAISTTRTFAARGPRARTPGAIFEALAVADVSAAADAFRPVFEASGGDDGFVSIEVSPAPGARHAGHDRRGAPALECLRAPERHGQDPRHCRGRSRDPAVPRRRNQHQHHTALLRGASPPGDGGLPVGARGPRRRRAGRSTGFGRWRASSSRAWTRTSTASSTPGPRRGMRKRRALRSRLAIANARLAYEAFEEVFAAPAFPRLSKPGAPGSSGHSGPRRPRRIRRCPTSTTSKRWSRPTRSTRCLPRPSRRTATTETRRSGFATTGTSRTRTSGLSWSSESRWTTWPGSSRTRGSGNSPTRSMPCSRRSRQKTVP